MKPLLISLLCLGVLSGWHAPWAAEPIQAEPTYEGKTLKEWVRDSKDKQPRVRSRAITALRHMGQAAAPALAEVLRNDKELSLRIGAVYALRTLGAKAEAAVPALSEALKDKNLGLRMDAALALGAIGPKAEASVPALGGALKDKDADVRLFAAAALGEIGPKAKSAMPLIKAALKDSDLDVRLFAALALRQIDQGTEASAELKNAKARVLLARNTMRLMVEDLATPPDPRAVGPADFHGVLRRLGTWSRRLMDADRDLSDKKADQVAALEAHLTRIRGLEELATLLADSGNLSPLEVDELAFSRLEAEFLLLKAKTK